MNEYQKTLWDDLMTLVEKNEAFYYSDVELWDCWFRIFNYRLASYTDFLEPNALECRGHMFQISEEGKDAEMLRLAALPPEKFFNLYENPMTMDLDLSTIDLIEDKADGSLISSYIYAGDTSVLRLKSKGSLSSDQAEAAMRWIHDNPLFMVEVRKLSILHYTVNMEWVAPDNRIVLGYETPELRVLNIRNNITGAYLDKHDDRLEGYDQIRDRWTQRYSPADPEGFVARIPDMTDIEGYVVRLSSGQRIKIKTTWYLALHHTKDNINSPRRLFEAVLEEATDDMKTLFHDDPLAIKTIEEMEAFVEKEYNHMVDTVERFYERNKHLERKEYALLGQDELKGTMFFGLAMNKYTGKPFSYKDFLKSKWKQLGLKDREAEE